MLKPNNPNTPFSSFEKSALNFMEELKKISIELSLLPADELRKHALFIACVKNLMSCTKKEIEDIEKLL